MIRRPPRSTLDRSSAASDVYKRQENPDFIVADAGSCDMGPRPLGADQHVSLESWQRHDLEAVSYTHLRAHETVLDLVCRLLLEKKKNNNNNNNNKNKKQER